MKAALYVVFSVIVTTLALQHPSEHTRRQDVWDRILSASNLLGKILPEDRRFNARDMTHFLTNVRRSKKSSKKSSNKPKKRIKTDHVIGAIDTGTNALQLGLDVYHTITGKDNAESSRRAFPRRQLHTGVNFPKKRRQLNIDDFLDAAEIAMQAAELYDNRKNHGGALKRRVLHSSRRSRKFDWGKGADLLTSGFDLAKAIVERDSRRASLRRQGGAKKDKAAAKGGGKADKGGKAGKGGGKAPAKEAPPAEKPGDTGMASAGGNPSWEDIFKQVVIKVISRRSGHTRRTFGQTRRTLGQTRRTFVAAPYDVIDLQQRSLHELLHMLYHMPYYAEPVYRYWNSEPGLTNGRVQIHSIKYSSPPQTADMDIRF